MAGARPEDVSDRAKDAPARRDGDARLGQSLPRSAGGRGDLRRGGRPRPSASREGDVVVSIHCGSRGLGHQIGTEFLKRDGATRRREHGIELPDRELACAPINSEVGRALPRRDARRASTARSRTARSSRTSRARRSRSVAADAELTLLYDVSHNTCKVEAHEVDGEPQRALRPPQGRDARVRARAIRTCPAACAPSGQPVLIGGTMGTAPTCSPAPRRAWGERSAPPATAPGRRMSRHQALRQLARAAGGRGAGGAGHPHPEPVARAASPRRRRARTRT